MTARRLLLLLIVAATVAAFFTLDLGRYLSPESFRAHRAAIDAFHAAHPVLTVAAYAALYVAVAALSLPVATALTLIGGALFGPLLGTVVVSFAASVGALLAFLLARFLLRDWVRQRFGEKLAPIDDGIRREGAFYLFALRLVPAFPFFLVNLAMGLTAMPARTFYWVSQLGMLPATALYVYAGAQLGRFELTPTLFAALALLGVFPLAARKSLAWLRARRVYARWRPLKPRRFDYDLVVIGAGAAGLVSAYLAAALRARVALVERHRMGGDCLYTGCVPSKTLLASARLAARIARASEYGLRVPRAQVDFAAVMQRVADVIAAIEPHDSAARYTALGVECIAGAARLTSPWTVQVQTADGPRTLAARAIVIATGARPVVPPIPGLQQVQHFTSETIWTLREPPARLLILGGGPIGCELAQAFARLGSAVTLVEQQPRLLPREDEDAAALLARRLAADGVRVLTAHRAVRFERSGDAQTLLAEGAGGPLRIDFDAVLLALGRRADLDGLGLTALDLETTADGTLATDGWLRTRYPNITACGDVIGPYQFTHLAAHQAWYATFNALFGRLRKLRYDDRVLPWAVFTDPEIARVGLTEAEARARAVPHEVTVYDLAQSDRARADGCAQGFVKVLTPPGSDRILGATIVGEHAAELLAEFVLAMRHGLGLNAILATIHVYPTLSEANKYAAGAWRRGRVSAGQQDFLAAVHGWLRGDHGLWPVLRRAPALLRRHASAQGLQQPSSEKTPLQELDR